MEVWDEREESQCREATLLAKDDWGCTAGSGMSILEFCRQRRLKESQFYWWQRKLKASRQERNKLTSSGGAASFALVSEDGASMPAAGAPGRSAAAHQSGSSGRDAASSSRSHGVVGGINKDAEFSGGHQGIPVHGAVRHAAFLRRAVDDGRTCDPLQSLLWTPTSFL